MIIRAFIDEDFVNYKKASMFIGFPSCSWKCEKECGVRVCQNSALATAFKMDVPIEKMVKRYMDNNITSAIVCGGLEPFDSFDDLLDLISGFRTFTSDDIVIYTGYYKEELGMRVNILSAFENIIIKYGRYIPGHEKHYDEVLGVYLASDNQYAEKIS